MCGRAKPEQPNTIALFDSSNPNRAKADDACAEQRCGMQIVEVAGNGEAEIRARQSILRIAPIDGVTSKGWEVAEVFHIVTAVGAGAVGAAEPGDADAGAE